MKIILIIIAAVIISAILLIIRRYVGTRLEHGKIRDKTYVCPNCGRRIEPKWYEMIFSGKTVYKYNCAKLKCPACGKWNFCKCGEEGSDT